MATKAEVIARILLKHYRHHDILRIDSHVAEGVDDRQAEPGCSWDEEKGPDDILRYVCNTTSCEKKCISFTITGTDKNGKKQTVAWCSCPNVKPE